MSGLSAPLDAYAAGPGDIAAARALAGHGEPELLALVAHLAVAQQRAHLEALGEAGLGKQVKKAARAAAYKLKSAGVSGEVKKAAGLDLTAAVELDRVAIIGPPGLDGQVWIVAAALPGAPGFEVDVKADGQSARIESAEDLGRARLKRLYEHAGTGRWFLAGADLAVRQLDVIEARLAGLPGGVPPSFEHAALWRAVAREHGASGARFDARQVLAGGDVVEPPAEGALGRLFEDVRVGFLVPPEKVLQGVDQRFAALMHSDEEADEEAFRADCDALLDEAADAWLEQAGGAAVLAMWLDADADMLLGRDDVAAARALLGLADEIRGCTGPGREAPLLVKAIRAVIDWQQAWEHRQAHIAGHAQHDDDE